MKPSYLVSVGTPPNIIDLYPPLGVNFLADLVVAEAASCLGDWPGLTSSAGSDGRPAILVEFSKILRASWE